MSLAEKYPREVKQILAKYPPEQKRSAVMPLLYLAQREEGYVTKAAMHDIAKLLDITETEVASIVGFYTLYHDEKAGKYRMQVPRVAVRESWRQGWRDNSRWFRHHRSGHVSCGL
jgi:NADH-quinone oxidoreductase subunit E